MVHLVRYEIYICMCAIHQIFYNISKRPIPFYNDWIPGIKRFIQERSGNVNLVELSIIQYNTILQI